MAIKQRPTVTGLVNAMAPNVDDPLGTNVKRRGMDAYYEEAHKSDPNYMSGPLPDPQWEGYGQSLADQGVTRAAMDAGRPHGIADDPAWATQGDVGGLSETGDHVPSGPLMESNNIAGPAQQLGRLSGRAVKPLPESYEVFLARLAKQYGPNTTLRR